MFSAVIKLYPLIIISSIFDGLKENTFLVIVYRIHVRLAIWILWVLFDNVAKAGMWVLIIIYNGDETILLCAYLSEESTSRNIVVSSTKRYFVRSSYIRYTQYPKPFFHVKVDSGQFLFSQFNLLMRIIFLFSILIMVWNVIHIDFKFYFFADLLIFIGRSKMQSYGKYYILIF